MTKQSVSNIIQLKRLKCVNKRIEKEVTFERVGNYVLLGCWDKFGMLKEGLGRHVMTGEIVKVKIVNVEEMEVEVFANLKKEIWKMKEADHPGLVKVYEIVEKEKFVLVVMEYCRGGRLKNYVVEKGKMREEDAKEKFKQLVDTLEYCHEKLIAHKDLMVENLVVDGNGNIKICDYGLSGYFYRDVFTKDVCGGIIHSPTKKPLGIENKKIGEDSLALGVILYFLLTGTFPFKNKNVSQNQQPPFHESLTIPSYLSAPLQSLLKNLFSIQVQNYRDLSLISHHPWLVCQPMNPSSQSIAAMYEKSATIILFISRSLKIPLEQIQSSVAFKNCNEISGIYWTLFKTTSCRPLYLKCKNKTIFGFRSKKYKLKELKGRSRGKPKKKCESRSKFNRFRRCDKNFYRSKRSGKEIFNYSVLDGDGTKVKSGKVVFVLNRLILSFRQRMKGVFGRV